jgi:glycosyltransferase involved in cell wall biosynthesis
VPIILAEQTIEYDAYLEYTKKTNLWPIKPLLYFDVFKIKRWETYYWRMASRLVTMSSKDKRAIQRHLKEKLPINVVANGVDTGFFDESGKSLPDDPTVLFVGTFKWLPNIDAVEFLAEKIWPEVLKQLPNAKLMIVGFSPSNKIKAYGKQPSIKVRGDVKDIREAYGQAHALLAPIRSGKGTRYKILESMATGTPIVATNLAVEGIGIKHGTHALMADSAKDLARLTVKLLKEKKLQVKLAQNSKKLVTKEFNWQAISKELSRVYAEVGK